MTRYDVSTNYHCRVEGKDADSREWHKLPVTVVIPTLNEAAQVCEAVSAARWADEVIVVDGGSTDGTPVLARSMGAAVFEVPRRTIAAQRNAGIVAARNDWILALDADERVPDELRDELGAVLAAPQHAAYRIQFRNFYLGRELRHGLWGRDWHVRLFSRDRRFVERRVHESLEPIDDVGSLSVQLEHRPYRDLTHHLEKMTRYARWGAEDLYARGRRAGTWDMTVVPAWRFFREFVIFSGWRDGRPGFVVAKLSACSAILKYAYLFALEWQAASRQLTLPAASTHERKPGT
jgi:glycosyltransferase involved in cell wall biosynthesis